MSANPLESLYRQPKIYLTLPSKGKYYDPDFISSDAESVPVFGMTAMDEIMLKTPDALFSGEAVAGIIRSCAPSIRDPWLLNQLDIDPMLIAIRIATFGQKMPIEIKCTNCGEVTSMDMNLSQSLDYLSNVEWQEKLVFDDIVVHFSPTSYKHQTEVSLALYTIQRQLSQVNLLSDEDEKNKTLAELVKQMNNIQYNNVCGSISYVEYNGSEITNVDYIRDWIKNADRVYFKKIKDHMESQNKALQLPEQKVKCASCDHENTLPMVGFDNANFFDSP